MRIINQTPHSIVLQSTDGSRQTIPPYGVVARVTQMPGRLIGFIAGVPTYQSPVRGAVEGLIDPAEGQIIIVSALVGEALRGGKRSDVYMPGTGPHDGAIRNASGQIEAVTRLIQCPG